MAGGIWAFCTVLLAVAMLGAQTAYGDVPTEVQKKINSINQNGTYLGVVIPNAFEMNPLLQSPSYSPDKGLPYVDFAGESPSPRRLSNGGNRSADQVFETIMMVGS